MRYRRLAVSAALATFSNIALADTDTFTVSAEVDPSCEVAANNLVFGPVNALSTNTAEATTTIDVTCTADSAYDIGLDGGKSNDVSARYMTDGGTNKLNYNIYQESTHTTVWGNTAGTDTVSAVGTGGVQTHTVYGQVPGAQLTVPAGIYNDTINVTIFH